MCIKSFPILSDILLKSRRKGRGNPRPPFYQSSVVKVPSGAGRRLRHRWHRPRGNRPPALPDQRTAYRRHLSGRRTLQPPYRFDFNVEIAVLDGIQDSLHLFGAQDRLIQISVHAVCLLRDGLAPITGSKHFKRQYFFCTHGRGAVTAPVCASGAISPLCFPHPHSITVEQKQQNDASPDWRRLRVLPLPARTSIGCPAPT